MHLVCIEIMFVNCVNNMIKHIIPNIAHSTMALGHARDADAKQTSPAELCVPCQAYQHL